MKYILSVAVLALLSSTSAVRTRFDDVFDDEEAMAENESLSSISLAEKQHGAKFEGLSKKDQ